MALSLAKSISPMERNSFPVWSFKMLNCVIILSNGWNYLGAIYLLMTFYYLKYYSCALLLQAQNWSWNHSPLVLRIPLNHSLCYFCFLYLILLVTLEQKKYNYISFGKINNIEQSLDPKGISGYYLTILPKDVKLWSFYGLIEYNAFKFINSIILVRNTSQPNFNHE